MISLRARRVACLIWMMAGRYDLHRVPLAALVTALLRVPYAHRGARPRQVVVAAAAQSIWSTFTLTYLDRSTAAPRLRLHRGPDPCLFTARDFVDCAQFASAACYTHIGRLEVNAVTAIGGRRPLVLRWYDFCMAFNLTQKGKASEESLVKPLKPQHAHGTRGGWTSSPIVSSHRVMANLPFCGPSPSSKRTKTPLPLSFNIVRPETSARQLARPPLVRK